MSSSPLRKRSRSPSSAQDEETGETRRAGKHPRTLFQTLVNLVSSECSSDDDNEEEEEEEGDDADESDSGSSVSSEAYSSSSQYVVLSQQPPAFYDIPVRGAASYYTLRLFPCGRHVVLAPMLTHLPAVPEVIPKFGGVHVVSAYLGARD